MNIRPSADLRNNYNDIIDTCKKTGKPVFLTKNGAGDSVVMDIESYNRRETMLQLREQLLVVEEARINGAKDYTIDEVLSEVDEAIKGVPGIE